MANSPVDRDQKQMERDFGTKVLITDHSSNYYLDLAAARRKFMEEQRGTHPEG